MDEGDWTRQGRQLKAQECGCAGKRRVEGRFVLWPESVAGHTPEWSCEQECDRRNQPGEARRTPKKQPSVTMGRE
jgi:hypothetical protein